MKTWLRLTVVVMTVGGGFAGFTGILQTLFQSHSLRPLNLLLMVLFLGLYGYVTVSGLVFVYEPRRTGPRRPRTADSLDFRSSYRLQVWGGPQWLRGPE